jgi:anti-sigma B factor antagonist
MTSDFARPQIELTRDRRPGHTLVTVHGELDIATTPELRERLYVALEDPGSLVVVDMSGVTFCDASGLAALLGARRRASGKGVTLVLAAVPAQVEALLEVTGLNRAIAARGSVEEALHADGPSVAA